MAILALDLGSEEQWRTIPGWPEYEISDFGSVRRVLSHDGRPLSRPLKPLFNKKTRYFAVSLCRNYKATRPDIHRLVALAFLGPPPSAQHFVAHNDGARTNNRLSNLRWATQKENLADCHIHGTAMVGSKNPMAKLSEHDVLTMRQMKADGVPVLAIARKFNANKRHVFRIVAREVWAHI